MEDKNKTIERKKLLTPEEAIELYRPKGEGEGRRFMISENTPDGCIDDRHLGERVAIPGGAGGIYLAVLDALKKYNVDPEKIYETIKPIVGCAIHTDEDHAKIEGASPVAGCGHCNGVLEKTKSDPKYFQALEKLFKELQKEMLEPVIYKGSHNASAVFVIDNLEDGLISNLGKEGTVQVYVYNQAQHKKILEEAGNRLFEVLKPAISSEDFNKSIWESAERQLKSTLDHLTNGLPFFYSSKLK